MAILEYPWCEKGKKPKFVLKVGLAEIVTCNEMLLRMAGKSLDERAAIHA